MTYNTKHMFCVAGCNVLQETCLYAPLCILVPAAPVPERLQDLTGYTWLLNAICCVMHMQLFWGLWLTEADYLSCCCDCERPLYATA